MTPTVRALAETQLAYTARVQEVNAFTAMLEPIDDIFKHNLNAANFAVQRGRQQNVFHARGW